MQYRNVHCLLFPYLERLNKTAAHLQTIHHYVKAESYRKVQNVDIWPR